MATGLLVVFVGRATRAVEFAESDEKVYLATLRLGWETDTQDITGEILRESKDRPSNEELDAVLPRFVGKQMQTPPMYSAIKIGGTKLVDAARRGEEIERPPREITVHELRHTGDYDGDPMLYVRCSKGTYVRTLCHDIGQALGCGACLASLRRITAGRFSIVDAYRIGEVNCEAALGQAEELLLPVDTLFEELPALTATAEQERRCRNGNSFPMEGENGRYRLYGQDGSFLALTELRDGELSTVKSFFEVEDNS